MSDRDTYAGLYDQAKMRGWRLRATVRPNGTPLEPRSCLETLEVSAGGHAYRVSLLDDDNLDLAASRLRRVLLREGLLR